MKKTKNNYSISKILRNQNRSNDAFEIQLANLSLEEIIALKLELAYRAIGFPIYGFPVWRSINYIIKEALVKYALVSTNSITDASKLLGIEIHKLTKIIKKYNIKKYFEEQNNDTHKSESIKGDIS